MKNKLRFLYKPPFLIKKIFNHYQWDSISQKVLITFDDGPNPATTEKILKELNNYSLKSVFFCVGENMEKYPSLIKEILSEGHDLGNHTFDHKKLTRLNKSDTRLTIEKVQNLTTSKFQYAIKYFRPPHGRFNLATNGILQEYKLINVMWSLFTYDYKNDINIVKFALTKYLTDKSIIVLHDSNKSRKIIIDTIKWVVEEVSKNEYQIGKPSECLKFYS